MSHSKEMKNKSNVTNRQKNRRTTDIRRPSSMYPAKKSSEMKFIECDWDLAAG